MSFKAVIIENINRVAKEQNRTLAPLSDNLPLQESGLDSLRWRSLSPVLRQASDLIILQSLTTFIFPLH
jgi:aryl carrier-like protein